MSHEVSDVFVSYRRKDVEFVKVLVEQLRAAGKEIWVDWDDIPPGSESFSDDIKHGLEGADTFIAVLSPDYLESTYCMDMELGYALELKKRIVPIVLHKFEDKPVPAAVGHINWIYFTPHAGHDNTFEESFPKVVQAIEQDLEHTRTHKRFLLRALEWDRHDRDASYLLRGEQVQAAEAWISTAAGKKPEPTTLHAEYITASRALATRRQRQILAGVSSALAVSLVLTVVAIYLGIVAENARQEAVRRTEETLSILWSTSAQSVATFNQPLAVALALESTNIDLPFAQTERALSEIAYQPGARQVFNGHEDIVKRVAIHPDVEQILSASYDTTARLWDITSGEAQPLEGHTDWVVDVAYSPDGATALSAACGTLDEDFVCSESQILLWDTATGEQIAEWRGHADSIIDADFSPDGSQVVTTSWDTRAIVWDAASGEPVTTFEEHNDIVRAAAFHPAGEVVVTAACANFDAEANVCPSTEFVAWDVTTGEPVLRWEGHTDEIEDLAFNRDGSQMISAGRDQNAILWAVDFAGDDPTAEAVATLSGHTERTITAAAFHPTEPLALTAATDGKIILWDTASGARITTYAGHSGPVQDAVFTPDGQHIISGASDNQLIEWDVYPGANIARYRAHTAAVNDMAITADGSVAVTAGNDGRVVIWDMAAGEPRFTIENDGIEQNAVAISPDETMAAVGGQDGTVRVYSLESGELLFETAAHEGQVAAVAFTPDGELIASGGADFLLALRDHDGNLVASLDHDSLIASLAFSSDGSTLAFGSFTGIGLWPWQADGEAAQILAEDSTALYTDLSFVDNDVWLVAAANNNTATIWDVASAAPVRTLEGHRGAIWDIAISSDLDYALTASDDNTLKLWYLPTGEILRVLNGHGAGVNSVAFLPDEREALSVSSDGTLRRWRVDATLDELTTWAQANRFVAGFTCEERELYLLPIDENCPA